MAKMRALIAGLFLTLALTGSGDVGAEVFSSPWAENPYARARLITTGYSGLGAGEQSKAIAGLQIELNPGWKTYWRVPGDSGIPPLINWEGSKNIRSIEIRWPAPYRFIDQYGMSIGYKNEIVLPVNIIPKDETAPVQLALELDYAVCADVCLPVNSKMALNIEPDSKKAGPFVRKLDRFEAKVPSSAEPAKGLRVRALNVMDGDKEVTLSFEVENPANDRLVDVFVEGNETLFFGTPKDIIKNGNVNSVQVPVSGAKSAAALKGSKLRFTLVGKKSSTDQYWVVGN